MKSCFEPQTIQSSQALPKTVGFIEIVHDDVPLVAKQPFLGIRGKYKQGSSISFRFVWQSTIYKRKKKKP